jgi:hypothetical protein
MLGRIAGNQTALQKSASFGGVSNFPANTAMLNQCINGGTTNGCQGNTAFEFTLTDTQQNPVAGPSAAQAIYNTSAAFCGSSAAMSPTSQCSLLATAKFTAICGLNLAANCTRASSIIVTYTIQQANVPLDGIAKITPLTESVTTTLSNSGSGSSLGTGTPNTIALWTSSTTLGDSSIIDTGTGAGISLASGTSPAATLDINGGVKVSNDTGSCDATRAGTIRYTGTGYPYEATGEGSAFGAPYPVLTTPYPGSGYPELCIQKSDGTYGWSSLSPPLGYISVRVSSFTWNAPGTNTQSFGSTYCNPDEVIIGGYVKCVDQNGTAPDMKIINSEPLGVRWTGGCKVLSTDTGPILQTIAAYCMKL